MGIDIGYRQGFSLLPLGWTPERPRQEPDHSLIILNASEGTVPPDARRGFRCDVKENGGRHGAPMRRACRLTHVSSDR
jgi:hypothetical protein